MWTIGSAKVFHSLIISICIEITQKQNIFLYLVENVSNVLLIISRGFLIMFLCRLYEQVTTSFYEEKSWLKTLNGMFSWRCNNMQPQILLRPNIKDMWKPSIKHWHCGKLSSSLVFEIMKMSTEPRVCWQRGLNLFLNK